MENNSERVGTCFSEGWDQYLQVVRQDVLFHAEMFAALDMILTKRFGGTPFSIADFGCGDSSAVLEILNKRLVSRYVGVDAAASLIERAQHVLSQVTCQKELIVGDMRAAIKEVAGPFDVIMSSYALHHLNTEDKARFIADAHAQLSSEGLLILIDGVLPDGQDREAYLEALEANLRRVCPNATEKDIAEHMEHPRSDDFPDSIATLLKISQNSGFAACEVIVDKSIFALLVMSKV